MIVIVPLPVKHCQLYFYPLVVASAFATAIAVAVTISISISISISITVAVTVALRDWACQLHEVPLARFALNRSGIHLHNVLQRLEVIDADLQRLLRDDKCDAFGAGRSRERARVGIQWEGVEMLL